MSSVRVVFVHGAGGAGAEAWPRQAAEADPGWHFLPRADEGDDPARDAGRVLALLGAAGGGHVVAHSYGANAALLACRQEPSLVRSLALLEPACFDLARGMPAVEEHIRDMTPVFAAAADPAVSMQSFFARFAEAMGFPVPTAWDAERESTAARLRRLAPPWDVGLGPDPLAVRTVVVTGGSDPVYDETASAIAGLGAIHRTLAGAGHRVQDDPRTSVLLRGFWQD